MLHVGPSCCVSAQLCHCLRDHGSMVWKYGRASADLGVGHVDVCLTRAACCCAVLQLPFPSVAGSATAADASMPPHAPTILGCSFNPAGGVICREPVPLGQGGDGVLAKLQGTITLARGHSHRGLDVVLEYFGPRAQQIVVHASFE